MDQWQQFERVVADEMIPKPGRVADITRHRWDADEEISAHDDRPPASGRRRWRRVAEPLVLLAAAATFFAIMRFAENRDAPAADEPRSAVVSAPATSARPDVGPSTTLVNAQGSHVPSPRFVVPATARRGDQITIVGYRESRLCGPTELHFDGRPIPHQIRARATPTSEGWVELYLTVTIPSVTSLGTHGLELFGPAAGGNAGALCGDVPEHQDRLADAEIIILP
jgi:hypothetical protein